MANESPSFGNDQILWYDNGRWGEAGYAIASPAGLTWTSNRFNEVMLGSDRPWWVVAVPVRLRLDGDGCSGMPIVGHTFDSSVPGWVDPAAGSCA